VSEVDEARVTLSQGLVMPRLGLGVWKLEDDGACEAAVSAALEIGYRHFDTAQIYGNEASVGRAIRASGLDRSEVFVTTKFDPAKADPVAELEGSLTRLGLDFVDLYLVHWPADRADAAWPGMQDALGMGMTRSIGVSNFSLADLDQLLSTASAIPVVNQVQFNPFAYRRALLDGCMARDVSVVAYSPLGMGGHLNNPTVGGIAKRLGKTPAQVLIRWCLDRGVAVIPRSGNAARIRLNFEASDLRLSQDDLDALDALDATSGTDRAREIKFWE
jgi:diketogulonate reductase-like aldo/keto reductase